MVFKCFNCHATDNLYAAPHTQEMRERWLELFPEGDISMFNDSFRICAEHFDNKYILPTGLLSTRAVPTKFLVHNVWCFSARIEKNSNQLTNEQILNCNTDITKCDDVIDLILPAIARQRESIKNFKDIVAPLKIFQEQSGCREFNEIFATLPNNSQSDEPAQITQIFVDDGHANAIKKQKKGSQNSFDPDEGSNGPKINVKQSKFKDQSVVCAKNPRQIMQFLMEELQDNPAVCEAMNEKLLKNVLKRSKQAEIERRKLRLLEYRVDHYGYKFQKYKLFWEDLIKQGLVTAETFKDLSLTGERFFRL